MPLYIGGTLVESQPSSVAQLMRDFPQLQVVADTFKQRPVQQVHPFGLLYVNQRQYAVAGPDPNALAPGVVTCLGTQDATTCNMISLRHEVTGVTALAHCDRDTTSPGVVRDMLAEIKAISQEKSGRIQCNMVGGFLDDDDFSVGISVAILVTLMEAEENIDLLVACITDMNNEINHDVNFPVFLGMCVEIQGGGIMPATFPEKGPDQDIRLTPPMAGCNYYRNCFDNETRELLVGPYDWNPQPELAKNLGLSNTELRLEMSTSPEQEPEQFRANMKKAMRVIVNNPYPTKTLFPDGKARRYKMTSPGVWTRVA